MSDFLFPQVSNNQFGFVPRRSTVQQLLLFVYDIQVSLQDKSRIDTIYLDIYRRLLILFLMNDLLLLKLAKFGITGALWQWFRSYLSNRTQVNCENQFLMFYLPSRAIWCTPGPLSTDINDMGSSIKSLTKLLLFADDSKCFHSISEPNDVHLLQDDVNLVV